MPNPPAPQLVTASWLRRIGALVIDWIAASLVSFAILGTNKGAAGTWLPLGVFWLESGVGTALAGASFGQLLTRIRVLRTNGRPVGLIQSLFRSLLICLVIPPLVFKPDGRGLQDLWTDSAAYDLPRRA